jgi:hypothetical protein
MLVQEIADVHADLDAGAMRVVEEEVFDVECYDDGQDKCANPYILDDGRSCDIIALHQENLAKYVVPCAFREYVHDLTGVRVRRVWAYAQEESFHDLRLE